MKYNYRELESQSLTRLDERDYINLKKDDSLILSSPHFLDRLIDLNKLKMMK